MPILEPAAPQDGLNRLRQQNLVDAANDAGNASAAGIAQTVPTGRGRGFIVHEPPRVGYQVRVRIESAASGGGKYWGWILDDPVAFPRDTSDLVENDVGTTPTTGADVLIVNMHEIGKSTHDLTQAPIVVKTFMGELMGINRDGDPVVAVNALDIKDCTTAPASTADFAPAEDPTVYHGLTGAAGEMAASAK
jgi:hypothetical protein